MAARCARSSRPRPRRCPPEARDELCRAGAAAGRRAGPARAAAGRSLGGRGDGERRRGRSTWSATAGSSRPPWRSRSDAELLHAIERILAPLGRRVDEASPLCDARLADGSRVNVVVPPLSLSGPLPHDPPLPPGGLLAARAGGERDDAGRRGRAAGGGRHGAGVGAGERRHRIGQDDDAERALGSDPRGRADRDDRGRGRAVAAPGARGAPRGAAAQPGGEGRGDDPPARAQRAADAPRPDRGGRGARRRGARPAPGPQHGPRRLALHRARQLAGGCAAPASRRWR